MGVIFGAVLFGPQSLQLQVLLVLIGVLILEAGVWGLTSTFLPNERRYLSLREEGDHFLGLIRELNAAAIAKGEGEEDDKLFRETRARMHSSVERMAELAGQDDVAIAEEAEALALAAAARSYTAESGAADSGEMGSGAMDLGAMEPGEMVRGEGESVAAELPAKPAARELD
jgi:hypothetical protein